MTREEAINILKMNNPFLGGDEYEMLSKAMDMAVSALQTDNDTVSRRAVIDLIARSMNNLEYDNENEELQGTVMALPSVQPEPCEDTISRADAIRVASGYCHPANVAKELAKLPNAQPDNSCDGCKYEDVNDGVLVPCGYCKRSHSDNYERRTDEQNI